MQLRFLLIIIFTAGFSFGWLAKARWLPFEYSSGSPAADSVRSSPDFPPSDLINDVDTEKSLHNSPKLAVNVADIPGSSQSSLSLNKERRPDSHSNVLAIFNQLLTARRYKEAIVLYQDHEYLGGQYMAGLKNSVVNNLRLLLKAQKQNDFSELADLFLAVYYDDIDVLLLLADFNQASGAYMDTINVYQLAKTYAYSDTQQQKLLAHFNEFVEATDSFFAAKKDWFALGNFYSHIEATGLLTSSYQYRQAIVSINSGDNLYAEKRLQQLVSDSLVGVDAIATLKKLRGAHSAGETGRNGSWRGADKVALQHRGNQYLVDLQVSGRDQVTLLIDTGASMTTLSQSAFLALSSKSEAVELGKRVFNTANGMIKGTVYSIPQLNLGSYRLENVQIAVLDFTLSGGVDGLLGMNVLGQFRFQIDQENVSLLLDRK
jgi:clan AA aspartic protease (TIGR02281 family)